MLLFVIVLYASTVISIQPQTNSFANTTPGILHRHGCNGKTRTQLVGKSGFRRGGAMILFG